MTFEAPVAKAAAAAVVVGGLTGVICSRKTRQLYTKSEEVDARGNVGKLV